VHQAALQWICKLLADHHIPFMICGGLAANAYGATRPLNDIDLFVPSEHFAALVNAAAPFISKPAKHYQEEGWDITYVQCLYQGVKIEAGSADNVRIFNQISQSWTALELDFSSITSGRVLDTVVPLMPKESLISYKTILGRSVDIEDIIAIEGIVD